MLELDGEGVQFRHELAQHAVYEALRIEERTEFHRQALVYFASAIRIRRSSRGMRLKHAMTRRRSPSRKPQAIGRSA